MKYLNLDKDFNPYNVLDEESVDFELIKFSGGEPHIKIEHVKDYFVTITARINTSDDMFILILAVDALRRLKFGIYSLKEIHLLIPYFPGARQDRVMVEGEPLTVKIYADLINDLKLNSVTILDPHSEVTPALINNVRVIDNHLFIKETLNEIYEFQNEGLETPDLYCNYHLISPDAGSNKKANKLIEILQFKNLNLVKCDKTRDVSTGKITGFEVYANDLEGKDCIIVDDICANGGTFLGLAGELKKKNAGDLYLVITHGEFGNDKFETLFKLTKVFKCIYCTDSIFNINDTYYEATQHYRSVDLRDKVKQIKIGDLL